ncbi:MAG: glycosyltransferase family 39 protein [Cyanobacteria bacterium P01_A01_bin.37]
MKLSRFPLLNHSRALPLIDAIIPLVYIIGVLTLMPLRTQFEFDTDEGLNLMKAVLVGEGYTLYRDIWNDQPPLFTVLLSAGFTVFGQSILVARLLVLAFGSLLVYCFHRLLRLSVGLIPAIAGTLLLISSYEFIRLSSSVMIGIPSLALALLSLVLMVQYQHGYRPKFQHQMPKGDRPNYHSLWLYASGFCFAASLQTKLITVVLIPLFCLHLLTPKLLGINPFPFQSITSVLQGNLNALKRNTFIPTPDHYRDALVWLLCLGISFGIMGLSLHYFHLDQVVTTHLQSRQGIEDFERRSVSLSHLIHETVTHDWRIYGLAGFGSAVALVGRHRRAMIPGLWLLTVFLVFIDHQPIWYHYGPLLLIPFCWLAAYSMIPLVRFLEGITTQTMRTNSRANSTNRLQQIAFWLVGYIGLLSIAIVGMEVAGAIAALRPYANPEGPSARMELVQAIQREGEDTQWLFTDTPLYGFYAKVTVPPELVVFSKKRRLTGQLTNEMILELMQSYAPKQILFTRFTREIVEQKSIAHYLNQHYRRVTVERDSKAEYFVKKTVNG